MREQKNISRICLITVLVLSHLMVGVVAYSYASLVCGIRHMGYSAPANVALLYAIPFIIGIVVCLAAAVAFRKNKKI